MQDFKIFDIYQDFHFYLDNSESISNIFEKNEKQKICRNTFKPKLNQ